MTISGWDVSPPIPQAKVGTRQGGTILLAKDEQSGEFIGFSRIINSPWGDIWIMEMCVSPDWRRKGVGRELVNKILSIANGKVVIAWGVD